MRSPRPNATARPDDDTHAPPAAPSFAIFQELAHVQLTAVLDSVRGAKVLVVDPALSPALSLVAEFSHLKEHGVEKIFHLESNPVDTECKNILYLSRPEVTHMQWIADHVREAARAQRPHEFTLYFSPRRTLVCDRILEEQGVLGDLTIGEYHLDLVPLEDDLASLELSDCFRSLLVDEVPTALFGMGRALMRVQALFGFFPRIVGKGDSAKQLCDMLVRMRRELAVDEPTAAQSNTLSQTVDALVLLDRSVDLISPLCTQLTYEGLIDERFGIRHSLVEVDANLGSHATLPTANVAGSNTTGTASANAPAPAKKTRAALNSQDPLFAELRDRNFSVVGGWLHRAAKRINQDYQDRHQARTVSQIRTFIGKLGGLQAEHQALKLHTYLAEEIYKFTLTPTFNRTLEFEQTLLGGAHLGSNSAFTDYVDELIGNEAPLTQILRLLCLQCALGGGLKRKMYDHWRREIVQTYGYTHLLTLERLARLRLLYSNDAGTRSTYPAIQKALQLAVEDVDETDPNDAAYVYSGFAPISVRLLQCIVRDPHFMDRARAGGVSGRRFGPGAAGLGVTAAWNSLAGPLSQAWSSGPASSNETAGARADRPASAASTAGWKGFEDVVQLLPGRTFDCVQTVEDANPYTLQGKCKAEEPGQP
ncbi:Vacuolar protein-sorting-associated protein 33 [Tieghemiomyces parasiticus]|uniref:Vacuolar protein-sorting-associated protein 33 n=1 Tax=Tieghemiomyces parasiticus TaxID=78921 RepID=A0A9W7ZQZ0_9FUNG|nr:Vacuolar protein-sorting-associated protein 33 [Tieghemiomyces parasiticus]